MGQQQTFLRLGVMCAVIDRGRLLLSQRGDLRVWALPGGRLDSGERVDEAAAREVREETGLEVQIARPIGLYYLAGWQRMNLLFTAVPRGGRLRDRTDETRANRWFPHSELPTMPLRQLAEDAFSIQPHNRAIVTPPHELRALRAKLAWRYVWNAMRGRPEPGFPQFKVSAAAMITHANGRLLTVPGTMQSLPRVQCDGLRAPWDHLAAHIAERHGLRVSFTWAGMWQNAERNQLEFVFSGHSDDTPRGAEWTAPRNAALGDRDRTYMEQSRNAGSVWTLFHRERSMQPGDTLISKS